MSQFHKNWGRVIKALCSIIFYYFYLPSTYCLWSLKRRWCFQIYFIIFSFSYLRMLCTLSAVSKPKVNHIMHEDLTIIYLLWKFCSLPSASLLAVVWWHTHFSDKLPTCLSHCHFSDSYQSSDKHKSLCYDRLCGIYRKHGASWPEPWLQPVFC